MKRRKETKHREKTNFPTLTYSERSIPSIYIKFSREFYVSFFLYW